MKRFTLTIFLCWVLSAGFSQSDTLKQVALIPGDIIDFNIDNLGNIFTLDRNNQLKKMDARGDSVAVFNDVRRYGKLYSIDASNPLKILLFYKDYGNIVVLDRLLNVRTSINFRKLNIYQVPAISQSYDNNIWIYDEQEARLKRLNNEGNLLDQSADFRVFIGSNPSPVNIIDQDKLLYLYDPLKGLFIFDYFLTLRNKLPLLGWQDFQVVEGRVFGRKGSTIVQYEPGTLSLKEQSFAGLLAGVIKIKLSRNLLYCLKEGTIHVYAF